MSEPKLTPDGLRTPRSTDCYRFVLSDPHVDACLVGPSGRQQLVQALAALDEGPLDPDEQAWMRAVGQAVRASGKRSLLDHVFAGIDRLRGRRYAQF